MASIKPSLSALMGDEGVTDSLRLPVRMTESGCLRRAGGLKMRVVLKEEVQKEMVIFVMQRCASVPSTETSKQGQNSTFYTKYTHVVCMELPSFHLKTS